MEINWFDESILTYEEAMELLNRTHEQRLEMEDKNKWDAYVNDFIFKTFLYDTYGYMLAEVKKEVDIKLLYHYPKIKDFMDLRDVLQCQHQEYDELAKVVLEKIGKKNIWEIVEIWWENVFKDLLSV